MDFPLFHLDFMGNRMLVAIIAILHVIINHALAVGFAPLVTILEFRGYQKQKLDKEKGAAWDEMARKLMFTAFIITTTLGALTGVGIWFAASLANPASLGSLIRVFYFAWFTEWIIFVLEVVFIMIYYLTWKKSNRSPQTQKKAYFIWHVAEYFFVADNGYYCCDSRIYDGPRQLDRTQNIVKRIYQSVCICRN